MAKHMIEVLRYQNIAKRHQNIAKYNKTFKFYINTLQKDYQNMTKLTV